MTITKVGWNKTEYPTLLSPLVTTPKRKASVFCVVCLFSILLCSKQSTTSLHLYLLLTSASTGCQNIRLFTVQPHSQLSHSTTVLSTLAGKTSLRKLKAFCTSWDSAPSLPPAKRMLLLPSFPPLASPCPCFLPAALWLLRAQFPQGMCWGWPLWSRPMFNRAYGVPPSY